jgi:hypothetical protein
MAELGARYNGFSLSEQSPTLAAAIEKIGQSVDSTYIATEELSSSLGAGFAEPMRESAQFAGVVRGVLRYRILKRVQEEMTRDELAKKQALLESLERSEAEANRIDQYLNSTNPPGVPPKRSVSSRSAGVDPSAVRPRRERVNEDTASIDSDFPPTHGDTPSSPQGTPHKASSGESPSTRTSPSGNFVTQKIFGRISHAMHGIVDVDPERTRRDQIGKTKESLGQVSTDRRTGSETIMLTLVQLQQALAVSEKDVKDASAGILKDLKRFQKEKEDDLKRYMVGVAFYSHLSFILTVASSRLHTPSVTLTGRRRTSKLGRRLVGRLIRLKFAEDLRTLIESFPLVASVDAQMSDPFAAQRRR